MLAVVSLLLVMPFAQGVQQPVLQFPEAGLDDPAAYQGYATRFFRDSRGNAFQVYLDGTSGRVVHVWADAANESAAFTVRDPAGRPTAVSWGGPGAVAGEDGPERTMRHRLAADVDALDLGWFLLGTMRQERDFQYQEWHRRPYGSPAFVLPELVDLIEALARLPPAERRQHLSLLDARTVDDLRSRLEPRVVLTESDTAWTVVVEQRGFAGRSRMTLVLQGDSRVATARLADGIVSLRGRTGRGVWFDVTATTDARALTPLDRTAIFNDAFNAFYARQRGLADSVGRALPPGQRESHPSLRTLRRIDREVAGLELLSSEEKLIASLPNYATYFGRDMMMAALMLEPIVSAGVTEHVIASVLRKVAPTGDVSHEEALGGQAIRENAAEYAAAIRGWEEAQRRATPGSAALLDRARELAADLEAVRENYRMIDDDVQLPVLVGRYLARSDVPAQQKRGFLTEPGADGAPRLDALVRNLALVAALARPYGERPAATNLVGFRYRDDQGWLPGSWRDSRAGYGNGRFAMDVNAVWVPQALEALQSILHSLDALELSIAGALSRVSVDAVALQRYVQDPSALRTAIDTWRGARRHFEVRIDAETVRERVTAALESRPAAERDFWRPRLERTGGRGLSFLALALDSSGRPIPAPNTDVATDLFLTDYTEAILGATADPTAVIEMIGPLATPYPVGLFVEGLGPVVVNDAYASPAVQRRFEGDLYHSPRVVWGREVNLVLLGLGRQIKAAYDASGRLRDDGEVFRSYVEALREVLDATQQAVEASGLRHNELWSYRIDEGSLRPIRYGASSDIQLWNLTDLAVRFLLDGLPPR